MVVHYLRVMNVPIDLWCFIFIYFILFYLFIYFLNLFLHTGFFEVLDYEII